MRFKTALRLSPLQKRVSGSNAFGDQDRLVDSLLRDLDSLKPYELQRDRKAGKKMWFLPHFAVKKDSETTPVRVV